MNWFFDLDGTLARTGEDIVVAWKRALTEMGRDISHFDEVFRIGPTLEKVVGELYPDATPELVSELLERFKPLYDESGFPNTIPYADIPETLSALKNRGDRLYIVTNKRHAPTRGIASKFGWTDFFDGIWSYDSFPVKYKKHELLAHLIERLSVKASNSVMVGDTKGDVDAGKFNGFMTIGVTWGYGDSGELSEADAIVNHPKELLTVTRG